MTGTVHIKLRNQRNSYDFVLNCIKCIKVEAKEHV